MPATTSRSKPAGAPAAPPPCGHEDLAEVATVLARVVTRLIVQVAPGTAPESFRALAVRALRVASDRDVDVIEAWLTSHA
jgi:hypothetical protein